MSKPVLLKDQLLSFFEEAKGENENIFLIDFIEKERNNSFMFLIDGIEPVQLSDIAVISRGISNQIDELIEDETPFTFQVSTPGADKPLKFPKQYIKHVGRTVKVITNEDIRIEGELISVNDESIEVKTPANKKKKVEAELHKIAFSSIIESKIKLAF